MSKKEYYQKMNFDEIIEYLREGHRGSPIRPVTVQAPTIKYMVDALQKYRTNYAKYKNAYLKKQQNRQGHLELQFEMLESILTRAEIGKVLGLNPKECGIAKSLVEFYNKTVKRVNEWENSMEEKIGFWEKLEKIIDKFFENANDLNEREEQKQLLINLETQNTQLKQSLEQVSQENTALQQKNQHLKAQLQRQAQNSKSLRLKYDDYYEEVANDRKDRARAEKQLKDLRQKVERYELSITTLKKQLQRQKQMNMKSPEKNSYLKQIQTKLDNQTNLSKELEKSNNELKKQCEKLRQLLKYQKNSSSPTKDDQIKLRQLQALCEAKQKQITDTNLQIEKLKDQLATFRLYSERIINLHEELKQKVSEKR